MKIITKRGLAILFLSMITLATLSALVPLWVVGYGSASEFHRNHLQTTCVLIDEPIVVNYTLVGDVCLEWDTKPGTRINGSTTSTRAPVCLKFTTVSIPLFNVSAVYWWVTTNRATPSLINATSSSHSPATTSKPNIPQVHSLNINPTINHPFEDYVSAKAYALGMERVAECWISTHTSQHHQLSFSAPSLRDITIAASIVTGCFAVEIVAWLVIGWTYLRTRDITVPVPV